MAANDQKVPQLTRLPALECGRTLRLRVSLRAQHLVAIGAMRAHRWTGKEIGSAIGTRFQSAVEVGAHPRLSQKESGR